VSVSNDAEAAMGNGAGRYGSASVLIMPGQCPNPQDPHAQHTTSAPELVRLNAAKRRGLALLTWRGRDATLEIAELEVGVSYSIGRRASMSVVIDWDPKVSGLHAELECIGGEWVIADDGLSRNGTRVNEDLVHGRTRLCDRDLIRIGRCLLAFHAPPKAGERRLTESEEDDPLPRFDRTDRDIVRELCRTWMLKGDFEPVGNLAIANELNLSIHAIKKRLGNLYARCGIHKGKNNNRAALMYFVAQHGIVSPRDYDDPTAGAKS
jgi:hypothetical protein